MKSQSKVAFAALFGLVILSVAVPADAQRTYPTIPRYTPPPMPRTVPRTTPPRPAVQRPAATSRPANTTPQHQTPMTPRPAQPSTSRPSSTPTNSPRVSRPQPAPQPTRAQQKQQQQAQARQQKEQAKQAQNAQKEQARRQKEEAKRQEKQKKEQARQEKERQKQEQKAQKEAARQNKGKKPASQAAAKPAAAAPQAAQAHSSSGAAYHAPEANEISGKTARGSMTLTRNGSESVVHQVNAARVNMKGANGKPLPNGDVTVHPNGRLTLSAAGGRQYGLRPDGTVSSYRDSAKSINFDRNGNVTSLRSSNLEVRHGSHGERSIVSHGANNTTLVSTGRHSGYMERNVTVGSHTYIQRTTVINHQVVSRNFVAFNIGGAPMVRFVAPVYFAPGFYGWAFYPWGAPVPFAFGWVGAPWYAGPNPYFTAYSMYPGAAEWLTDYALGDTLNKAYQMDADADMEDGSDYSADAVSTDADEADQTDRLSADAATPISLEIKDAIADQVKQELAYDSAASTAHAQATAYDEVTSVLNRPNHAFVVSSILDVTTVDEQVCSLQAGDILRLADTQAGNAELVQLRVASSKRRDCPSGVTVTVSLSDLQEMHNSFRAHVEAGLSELQAKQGHDGIPAAPAEVAAPPRPTTADVPALSADEVNSALDAQRQQANQAEAQIVEDAFSQGQ